MCLIFIFRNFNSSIWNDSIVELGAWAMCVNVNLSILALFYHTLHILWGHQVAKVVDSLKDIVKLNLMSKEEKCPWKSVVLIFGAYHKRCTITLHLNKAFQSNLNP